MRVTFDVVGLPAPKGSSRAMMKGGFAVNVPSGSNVTRDKLRSWNSEVMAQAVSVMNGSAPSSSQAVIVRVFFRFPRPQSHFTKKGLKPTAPRAHTSKPDLDKLIRSTWDAMAGIVYDDDSRIHEVVASKVYCNPGEIPGATIAIDWPDGFDVTQILARSP